MTILEFIRDAAKDTTKRVIAKTEAFLQGVTTTVDNPKEQQNKKLFNLSKVIRNLEELGVDVNNKAFLIVYEARKLLGEQLLKVQDKKRIEKIDMELVGQATKNVETILSLMQNKDLTDLKEEIGRIRGKDLNDLKKYATEKYDELLKKIYSLNIKDKNDLKKEIETLKAIIDEKWKSIDFARTLQSYLTTINEEDLSAAPQNLQEFKQMLVGGIQARLSSFQQSGSITEKDVTSIKNQVNRFKGVTNAIEKLRKLQKKLQNTPGYSTVEQLEQSFLNLDLNDENAVNGLLLKQQRLCSKNAKKIIAELEELNTKIHTINSVFTTLQKSALELITKNWGLLQSGGEITSKVIQEIQQANSVLKAVATINIQGREDIRTTFNGLSRDNPLHEYIERYLLNYGGPLDTKDLLQDEYYSIFAVTFGKALKEVEIAIELAKIAEEIIKAKNDIRVDRNLLSYVEKSLKNLPLNGNYEFGEIKNDVTNIIQRLQKLSQTNVKDFPNTEGLQNFVEHLSDSILEQLDAIDKQPASFLMAFKLTRGLSLSRAKRSDPEKLKNTGSPREVKNISLAMTENKKTRRKKTRLAMTKT